jgi:hypothetical protein
MSKKLKVGIDINEVLRAKWLQFDRFYAQEFGEKGIPKETSLAYTYDFFKTYRWEDTTEVIKELKEPEDMPDDINPVHYQVDEKTGEADADTFLFKKPEEVKLSAKEVYNRFMYEDYCFEIHGSAPFMYKGMDLHIKNFCLKYDKTVDFVVMSVENYFSIPPTLFFLSKMTSRFKEYKFVDNSLDMWKNVDVLITSDPEILKLGEPWFKKLIKVKRPYNENIKAGSLEILQINDLIDNPIFEKIIKYKK